MRLKSFQAKTMGEAMRQVKEALGDDAIIVSTREEKGWFRITAAVEQENAAPPPKKQRFDDDAMSDILSNALLKHRVPAALADKIILNALSAGEDTPQEALAGGLRKTFPFKKAQGGKPLLLAGPPGAGKTLMAAKLAARAVLAGGRPAVITTDIARAGGVEQLQAFLDILSLPLLQAEDAKTLKTAIAKAKSADQIIVDTGGLNPFDPQEMKLLARMMAVEDMDACLVLPAGVDAEESAEMAMTFGVLGVKDIIPTRLDFARRIGGILNAADRAGLGFTIASHTPQVAEGLMAVTPEALAKIILPVVEKPTSSKKGRK